MSLKDVQVALEGFLSLNHGYAIAISGNWGSGKTYFWGEVIKDASQKGLVKKYSYVSLFGINNLADLKSALFDNAVSASDVSQGANSSTWVQNVKDAMQSSSFEEVKDHGHKFLNFGRKNVSQVVPLLGSWGGVARSLSFFAVKDYVICLDDVERKGAGLPLKDVLGLVSMLKEQRECRVVVILNEDELDGDKPTLSAFKEKVFDREIVFSPSVEECAALVFTDEWEHSKQVVDEVVQLDIKNIRVLKRIRRVIETLLPYVQGKDEALKNQLIHSSVLLTWCYNSRGKDVPPYEFVKDTSLGMWSTSSKSEEKSNDQKLAEKVLSDYGYRDSDEFDLNICQFLEYGYVVEDQFVDVVNSFQEMALKNNQTGSFTGAWRLFHDTFSDNEDVLVKTLRERFLDGTKWISLGNAMGTVKLMREINHDGVADEMMNQWIEMAKRENRDLLNPSESVLFSGSTDEKFLEALKTAYANDKNLPTLSEAIKDASGRRGWGAEQIQVLSQASVDDYFNFFKSIDLDEHLNSYIKTCLQFVSSEGDERYKKISQTASEALRKIAKESQLNKVRVAMYLPDVAN